MATRRQILSVRSLSAVFLSVICIGQLAAQQPTTSSPPTHEVKVLLTALDKDQNPVNTLKAEDLRVTEEGVRQSITGLHPITDRTVSLAILIDTSLSQERTLDGQKLAASSFVKSVVRPDRDQAAIATFTGTFTVEQKLTNDLSLLQAAIARARIVVPPGYVGGGIVVGPPPPPSRSPASLAGATAIWDAVIEVCQDLLSQSAPGTRRAIILLTDGIDTISKHKLAEAVDRASLDDVVVYSIGIGDGQAFGIERDPLRKLSERTGGQAFFPKRPVDLPQIFGQIEQELRNQYLLTYNAAMSGDRARKVKVEIANPALKGVKLFYQQAVSSKIGP